MAPPLPLPQVAGTLALSFTAGRAAPVPTTGTAAAAEPTSIQQPAGVPKPPVLPAVPGEEGEAAQADPPTTEAAPTDAAPEPAEPPSREVGTPPPPVSEPEPRPAEVYRDDEPAPVAAEPAKAKPELFGETDRRRFFNLFAGSSHSVRGYSIGAGFRGELALGGFNRTMRVGGAGVVQVGTGFPFGSFTLAPRLYLNRQILPDYAFYFTTTLTLGYRATTYAGYGLIGSLAQGGELYHGAVMGVGWGASAILGERLLLSFRPVNVELTVPSPTVVGITWDVLAGLGVVW